MANRDSLGPSLSDEEVEVVPKDQEVSNASPSKNKGYKFNVEQNLSDGFNFAERRGNGEDANVNGHSSSDVEEDFEHLNPPDDSNGSDQNSAPTTPTKTAPSKRTAHGTGAETVNGSPPSSPAPKKRKEWEDYVNEHEEKKRKHEESMNDSGGRDYKNILVAVAIIVALASVGAAILYPGSSTQAVTNVSSKPRYTWKKASSNFFNWTQDLRTEFPMQNKETWIALIASITSTMEKTEPVHPAAITALFPPTVSQEFATCFLHKVGRIVNKAVAPILRGNAASPAEVKMIEYSTFETTSSFSKFRPDIEDYFKNRGKAAITIDIDKFKSEDALLQFHGLCDNFLAVDKRATLFFPIRVPELIFDKFEWIHERGGDISNDVLTESWKNVLSADTGPALVARVTDTVILLNEGDSCSL